MTRCNLPFELLLSLSTNCGLELKRKRPSIDAAFAAVQLYHNPH
jgi:hypothetical protein